MYEFFAFVFGVCWGSFLNVAVNRPRNKKKNERSLMGRSFCDSCKKNLSPIDLLPIFSYIILRGRCRYCKSPIPLKNLLAELVSGIFFVLGWIFLVNSDQNLLLIGIWILIFFFFIYLSVYDLWWQEIPLAGAMGAVGLSIIYRAGAVIEKGNFHIITLVYLVIPLAVIFLINMLYKKQAFGAGDYLVLAVVGLTCTPVQIFVSMETAILSAAVVGIIFAIKIRKFKGVTVALVPFLNFGWLIALNFAEILWNFLLHSRY